MAAEGPFSQVVKPRVEAPVAQPAQPVGPFTAVAEGPTRPQQGPFTQQAAAQVAQRAPQSTGNYLTRAAEGAVGVGKGLLTGLQKSVLPEQVVPKDFYQATGHPGAEALGEFAGTVGTGLGAYSLGKAAMTRVLAASSPRVARFLAQTGAETIPLMQPGLLRAGGSVGGAFGLGAEQGIREAVEGGSPADIAKRAGGAAALTLGGDAAIYGAARLFNVAPRDPRLLFGQASEDQVAALGAIERELAQAQQVVGQKARVIHQQLQTGTFKDSTVLADYAQANAKANQLLLDRSKLAYGSQAFSVEQDFRLAASEGEKALAAESVKLGQKVQQLTTDEMTAQINLGFQKLMGTTKRATKAETALKEVQKSLGETRIHQAQKAASQRTMLSVARGESALTPAANFYLSDHAGNKGKWLYGMVQLSERQDAEASRFMAKVLTSPDTIARSQGLAMGVLGNEAIEAAAATRTRANKFRADMNDLWEKLAKAKGVGIVRSHIPSAPWARDIREVHELQGGVQGVHQQFGPEVGGAWENIINRRELEMTEAEKVAGALRMSPAEKARLLGPTGDYYPQVPVPKQYLLRKDPRAAALVKLYAKQGRPITVDEAQEILNKLESNRRAGLRKVGNLDFERSIPGSTGEKVAAGWKMVDDPRQAMEVYGQGLAHRIEYARRFGNNLELVDAVKEAARQEGANMAMVHTAADLMTGATYFDAAFSNAARKLTTIQVLEKMGLAALPNLSQQVNTVLFAGLKNFGRGLAGFRSSASRERVLEGMASQVGILSVVEHAASEGAKDRLGLLTRGLLNVNAFSPIENLNRSVGMMVSQSIAKDLVAKGLAGRLKGATLSHARNQAASLGFDLSKVLQRGGQLTDPEMEGLLRTAMTRGARETQFVPDLTRLPYFWQHPYGKLIFQFKSYAFSQGKFIRDAVLRETIEGNMKPLAYYLTFYPMVGEMVASALDDIRGRPRERAYDPTTPFTSDLNRYLTTMASVGSMGIAWNLYTGAKYDNLFTALAGGPTVGDINDVAKAVFSKHPSEELLKKAQRSPSYRFGELVFKAVMFPVEKLVEAAKASVGDEEPAAAKSLDQLLMESAQAKRGNIQ